MRGRHHLHRGTVSSTVASCRPTSPRSQTSPGSLPSTSPRAGCWRRLRHEWRRSGWRTADVLAFRLFYGALLRRKDAEWIRSRATGARCASRRPGVPVLETEDPNSAETREFLQEVAPDLVVAACKTLLRREIFEVPAHGTFVVHPGICPEYRNAHGCFWALARRDLERVGATLLRIDEGVDTGPVFGHYSTSFDERRESACRHPAPVVYDNIDRISADLRRIAAGEAEPIDTTGRLVGVGPAAPHRFYLRWKRAAGAPP